jgi:hypothetical protein
MYNLTVCPSVRKKLCRSLMESGKTSSTLENQTPRIPHVDNTCLLPALKCFFPWSVYYKCVLNKPCRSDVNGVHFSMVHTTPVNIYRRRCKAWGHQPGNYFARGLPFKTLNKDCLKESRCDLIPFYRCGNSSEKLSYATSYN